ncbi:MAG: hypothetical protein Q9170_002285 [Blastenia crenularia]
MKDLYTFDTTQATALTTYQRVRKAYDNFFDELQVRFVVARAASGDIGGSLSHEYHIPTASGEDTFIQCGSCAYAANEEWMPEDATDQGFRRTNEDLGPHQSWFGISRDRCHLVEAVLPRNIRSTEHPNPELNKSQINPYFMKSRYPDLDLGVERPLSTYLHYWEQKHNPAPRDDLDSSLQPRLTRVYDYRVSQSFIDDHEFATSKDPLYRSLLDIVGSRRHASQQSSNLVRVEDGDECPYCGEKALKVLRTLELGHTFHLGQRYSKPMDATFAIQLQEQTKGGASTQQIQDEHAPIKPGQAWFQMGCHGIGISRIIAAVADSLADERGLIWPRVMAPYEAVILATEAHETAAEEVWDILTRQEQNTKAVEAVLDDREKSLGWKLKDADLIGFPIVIILGSTFRDRGFCEVSIRRLNTRQEVEMENLREYIASRLAKI